MDYVDEEISIQIQSQDDPVIIKIGGYLNIDTSPRVHETLAKILDGGKTANFIFVLSDLEYVSSAGVGVFMNLYQELDSSKGKISLVGLSDNVRRVLELLGFLEYFGDFATLDEGKAYINSN